MSNEAFYAELIGSEAWIITNFSNPFFLKNNFLFRTLLSASPKLNAEGSLVSLGTSIPATQFYAANRFASRLVAGTKLFQILPIILRKGCSQHRKHTLSWRFLGLSLDKQRSNKFQRSSGLLFWSRQSQTPPLKPSVCTLTGNGDSEWPNTIFLAMA